jgi:thiol-disulfide isomerase/thioredoxin
MKMQSFMLTIFFGLTLLITQSCKENISKDDYLRKVLTNLDQIKSATYFSTSSASAPGDTLKFVTYKYYNKEYTNPSDTFIGSTFAWFLSEDTTKMYYFYDGLAQAYIDTEMETVQIDSFQTNRLPFRPIGPPFFNYTKSIIKYALETKDSISTQLKDFGDSVLFSLAIYGDSQVEFFGKPVYNKNPYGTGEEISKYDIWIYKSNDLPCWYKRNLSHSTSWEATKNVKINNTSIEDFIPSNYFPPDYKIPGRGKGESIKIDLTGKIAPEWTLKDFDGNPVALKDLRSKILIIEFTGIGCGPCHASIPFLKSLMTDYKSEIFELVSIETWSKNIEGIKRYYINNNLNYKYLISSNEVVKDYQVRAVPTLFILDKDRVIRKVIEGYEKGTTDKEIRDIINDLINKKI